MAAKPATKDDIKVKDLPEYIFDRKHNKRYKKGKFMGKGGFAKCYELIDMDTNMVYAGKVVQKSTLVKPSQQEKMTQEINIHKTLKHEYIVGFYGYFEDEDNIYILLEMCSRQSFMELHKRRKHVSEPEARYYMRQIILGCQYLHEQKVIHRDLKLGNLFLNGEMVVKLGDFGLATRVDFEGERKKTLCGTPNYIAPEILMKKGHSFEVDVWSLGCIVYTLLVGKPPFETSSLKDTYQKIRQNQYTIPARLSTAANRFIRRLLCPEPSLRPSMFTLLEDEFFKVGYLPTCLPVSALTTLPRFDISNAIQAGHIGANGQQTVTRKPLTSMNTGEGATGGSSGAQAANPGPSGDDGDDSPMDCWLGELHAQVTALLPNHQELLSDFGLHAMGESEDPASAPIFWVSKWVDYSDKYGLAYMLCDNSVGVLYNDSTRLLLTSNQQNLQFIEREGTEYLFTVKKHPTWLAKKVSLLQHFKSYMQEKLLTAGENMVRRESDDMTRLPFMRTWFRTRGAIILQLSNGTLQINFFDDHTKIILCPLMGAVTYIDAARDFKTFRFKLLQGNGMVKDLSSRLNYARSMMGRLLMSKVGSGQIKMTGCE